jgi:hypothetical protein
VTATATIDLTAKGTVNLAVRRAEARMKGAAA